RHRAGGPHAIDCPATMPSGASAPSTLSTCGRVAACRSEGRTARVSPGGRRTAQTTGARSRETHASQWGRGLAEAARCETEHTTARHERVTLWGAGGGRPADG